TSNIPSFTLLGGRPVDNDRCRVTTCTVKPELDDARMAASSSLPIVAILRAKLRFNPPPMGCDFVGCIYCEEYNDFLGITSRGDWVSRDELCVTGRITRGNELQLSRNDVQPVLSPITWSRVRAQMPFPGTARSRVHGRT